MSPGIDQYLAQVVAKTLPPDNAIRTGRVTSLDGGSVTVLVNGGLVPAGYLTSYVPRLNDTVALTRQDAGWPVLGSLYGDAAPVTDEGNPFADEWHLFTLSSGWTHRSGTPGLQYRFAWSPDFVLIMGQILPGTVAENQLIATLPPAYRPKAEQIMLARKAPNAFLTVAIQADGSVRIYDTAGASVVQFGTQIMSRTTEAF